MLNEKPTMYEITPLTLAILAKKEGDKWISHVLEDDDSYMVVQSTSKVMDYACKFFGSSLKGRQEGVKDICGISHKAPICIDPSSGMYFFPTSSPQNPNCSWIAHSHIEKVEKASNHCTKVTFKNQQSILLEVSYGSIRNQIQRTAQFRYLLDARINYLFKNDHADRIAESFR